MNDMLKGDVYRAYRGQAYCGGHSINRFERYNGDLCVSGWKNLIPVGLMMPLQMFGSGNFGFPICGRMRGRCVLAMNGRSEFGVIRGVHDDGRITTVHAACYATRRQPEPAQRCRRLLSKRNVPAFAGGNQVDRQIPINRRLLGTSMRTAGRNR